MLSWKPGQPITCTRLSTPAETVAMASLSDTYQAWVQQFNPADDFLRLCVNMGVPLQTSYAIDMQVKRLDRIVGGLDRAWTAFGSCLDAQLISLLSESDRSELLLSI